MPLLLKLLLPHAPCGCPRLLQLHVRIARMLLVLQLIMARVQVIPLLPVLLQQV
jgi:hypothetical protein